MRRIKLIVFAMVIISILVPLAWVQLAWPAGFLAGTFVGLWRWLRDDPPEYVARWGRGAEGELRTAHALLALPPEWHVRHDVESEYGNRDHIVVGPAGVFLLDSKNLGGKVTVHSSGVVVERSLGPDFSYRPDLGRSLRGQAAGLSAELALSSGLEQWVQPVAVIWGDFPQRSVEHNGVAYVHGDQIAGWIVGRPNRLSGRGVLAVRKAMDKLAPARLPG